MSETKIEIPAAWNYTRPSKEQLAEILRLHGDYLYEREGGRRAVLSDADLSRAVLSDADLSGAVLSGAVLRGADLRGAVLSGAVLRGAVLSGAVLRGAVLSGAVLRGADLRGADLRGAVLSGAVLRGADLSDAVLPDGVLWQTYLDEVVPALLQAGGKKLQEVTTPEVWSCHTWGSSGSPLGCPIATAFSVHDLSEVPPLYRAQANLFIQLFDNGLVPLPKVPNAD